MASAIKVAAALLVVGLSGQLLSAEAGLTGLKGLFHEHADKNYVLLAEHLFKATQSSELAENTEAAELLLGAHSGASDDLIKLVNAFTSLRGGKSGVQVMCGRANLANMRAVAEAANAGGNLGKKNTGPVRRLNLLVVELIAYARSVCPAHLDSRWPEPWNPNFPHKDMRFNVEQLHWESTSLLYGQFKQDAAHQRYLWGSGLSLALSADLYEDLYALRNIDFGCKDPRFTLDKACLTHQLRYYVYRPCREFVEMREARQVLEPYGDLLTSWYAVKDYLNTEDLSRQDRNYNYDQYNVGVRRLALGYGVCKHILDMPEDVVAYQVRKSRKHDQKQQKAN